MANEKDPFADLIATESATGDPFADLIDRRAPAKSAEPDVGIGEAATRGFIRGSTLGAGTQYGAMLRSLPELGEDVMSWNPFSKEPATTKYMTSVHNIMRDERERNRQADEQRPIASTAGKIVGGVPMFAAAAPLGIPGAAGVGAAQMGGEALGQGATGEEALWEAGKGALGGAVGGAAAKGLLAAGPAIAGTGKVMQVPAKTFETFAENIPTAINPARVAIKHLQKQFPGMPEVLKKALDRVQGFGLTVGGLKAAGLGVSEPVLAGAYLGSKYGGKAIEKAGEMLTVKEASKQVSKYAPIIQKAIKEGQPFSSVFNHLMQTEPEFRTGAMELQDEQRRKEQETQ